MKQTFLKTVVIVAGILVGPLIAFAINITVPAAPGYGYTLVSTSTGAYVSTTTDPFHAGSFFATSTNPSRFPYASTTALSGTWLCIGTDCRSVWPTSGVGGTGLSTSSPVSAGNLLVYSASGAGSAFGVATNTVTCSGSVACTPFTVLSSGAITLVGSASGGTGLATSSPTTNDGVLVYNSVSAGSAYTVATTSLSISGPFSIANSIGVLKNGTVVYWGLATTSATTQGQLYYASSNSGGVTSVGTTTITYSGWPATIPAGYGKQVGGADTTFTYWGLATTSQPASSNVLVSNGRSGVFGVATTAATCGTGISCTGFPVLGGSNPSFALAALGSAGVLGAQTAVAPTVQATSTLYGTGTGGQVLGWSNATNGLAFVATSSAGGAGTPGGANKQIQFNDSSAFGGDYVFNWDKTLRFMGIGTSTPFGTLSVEAASTSPTLASIFNVSYGQGSAHTTIFNIASSTSGALGIGTTSPSQAISVAGKVYATGGFQFGDGSLQTTAYPGANVQQFLATTSNPYTWTKPANAKTVLIIAIGGGGQGNSASATPVGGGGGGGGACVTRTFLASDLQPTMSVTVGDGGYASSTPRVTISAATSTVSNNSILIVQAGFGVTGAQGTGTTAAGGAGGSEGLLVTSATAAGTQGASGGTGAGKISQDGGGGGGGGTGNAVAAGAGGTAYGCGGGAGGGGGDVSALGGGGGQGGQRSGAGASNGASAVGTGIYTLGAGGGAGGDSAAAGGNGAQPGGGGGGGAGANNIGGNGGMGAVTIITYF